MPAVAPLALVVSGALGVQGAAATAGASMVTAGSALVGSNRRRWRESDLRRLVLMAAGIGIYH